LPSDVRDFTSVSRHIVRFLWERDMDSVSGIFCPVCKHKNEPGAAVCVTCGAPLAGYSQVEPPTIPRVNRGEEVTNPLPGMSEEAFQKAFKTPEKGIAIYVPDYAELVGIREEDELTLGRLFTGDLQERFVDLKPYYAYENGVSRRHALIHRTDQGYEILDLDSTNGTWLNNKPLIPHRPYPLESGSQVRLGRLQIIVTYPETIAKP
jgi:hypothetical protein